jgi:hypothetical protein
MAQDRLLTDYVNSGQNRKRSDHEHSEDARYVIKSVVVVSIDWSRMNVYTYLCSCITSYGNYNYI